MEEKKRIAKPWLDNMAMSEAHSYSGFWLPQEPKVVRFCRLNLWSDGSRAVKITRQNPKSVRKEH